MPLTKANWRLHSRGLALVACGALLVGVVVWRITLAVGDASREAAEVVTFSTDAPDERMPDASFTWRGSSNDPKRLRIPQLGIEAYVQNVGVDQNSEIAVPSNIHLGGWFVDSVRPGEKGLAIIAGHVNGTTVTRAVFTELAMLSEGNEVSVELGSGSQIRYVVVSNRSVPHQEAASVLYSQRTDIESQLNLITCGGEYSETLGTYENRQIVTLRKI